MASSFCTHEQTSPESSASEVSQTLFCSGRSNEKKGFLCVHFLDDTSILARAKGKAHLLKLLGQAKRWHRFYRETAEVERDEGRDLPKVSKCSWRLMRVSEGLS